MTDGERQARVLLVTGGGRYRDEWHDTPATSAQIRDILSQRGLAVTESHDPDEALTEIDADLVVVNIGKADSPTPAAREGLERYLQQGGALLAVHSSATAFAEWPRWEEILGGRWVEGESMHPAEGDDEVRVTDAGAELLPGIRSFRLFDERYSYLRVSPDVEVLLEHDHDDLVHPLVWRHAASGARIAFDALGHGTRAWESPERRRLFGGLVDWLLGKLRA